MFIYLPQRRLTNDLSDTASELTLTKRKLAECQKEVERMKAQLREYVQEIQRAEELLCIKVIRLSLCCLLALAEIIHSRIAASEVRKFDSTGFWCLFL